MVEVYLEISINYFMEYIYPPPIAFSFLTIKPNLKVL